MVKGEFYTEENPDFKIKSRGFDLAIYRKYKSRLVYNGPFGFGWTWNHSERIMPLENNGAIYYDNDGTAFEISQESGAYVYPKGSRFILEKITGGYIVTQNETGIKSYFSNNGYLTKREDPFGNTLEYEYSNTGFPDRITKIKDALGRSLVLGYTTTGKIEKITDFSGRYCGYLYNGDDLVKFTDLEGNFTEYQYLTGQENEFNNHNMSRYTLPNGDWLEIGYFKNDQAAYHTNKKGETFNFMYSRLNRYAETRDEEGYYRKVFFNENNDVTRIAGEDGTIESMEYDEYHNKISHTDGNGNTTLFRYYPDGTPEAQQNGIAAERKLYIKTNASGNTWRYKYESGSNPFSPTEIIDPEGNVTRFVYNGNSSLAKKIQAPGYEHDAEGRLIENSSSEGLVTFYSYDEKGNVLTVTDPDGSIIENIYDTDKLYLVTRKDRNGHMEEFDYYAGGPVWEPLGLVKTKSIVLPDHSKN